MPYQRSLGGFWPVTGAFEAENVGVVHDAVDHRGGDGLVAEDLEVSAAIEARKAATHDAIPRVLQTMESTVRVEYLLDQVRFAVHLGRDSTRRGPFVCVED